jgi:hypothetical protein
MSYESTIRGMVPVKVRMYWIKKIRYEQYSLIFVFLQFTREGNEGDIVYEPAVSLLWVSSSVSFL